MAALGYVIGGARGAGDKLLAAVAERLGAEGWPLAGVVQINTDRASGADCDMDLRVLGRSERIRISQNLGSGSRGCRLDPEGLQTAVGLVETTMTPVPRLLIVNKFGKAEIEGSGFRALIGDALAQDIPVLLGLKPLNLPGFEEFAQGLAEALPGDLETMLDWCRAQAAAEI
ncbi:DUF2478 domain-containing protein [Pararhodobacter zhoushanensis]|uniref:DUF2478 domain-containing protein n=1 Tax=Pararhodobacter zhoushanensis TaxID=2479545 RepID=UPI000F8EC321|nr:DUF2478 domain-containing protein [Pararhodobacter zhoushanensis]